MTDKRRTILAAALKLFARKGYHAASMQEIAEEAGVAKGSIYLYFRSKDELALSVVTDIYERVRQRMAEIEADESLTPRERFIRQLEVQLAESAGNAEWIQRLWHDQTVSVHDALPGFILRIRAETAEWLRRSIRSIYGEAAGPHACDISLMMQGAMGEFVGFFVLSGKPIEPGRLSRHLVSRLDDIAAGLAGSGEQPLIHEREYEALIRKLAGGPGAAAWQDAVRELRRQLETLRASGTDTDGLEEALRALETEAGKMNPRRVVLRGMLHYLRMLAPDQLLPAVDHLDQQLPR